MVKAKRKRKPQTRKAIEDKLTSIADAYFRESKQRKVDPLGLVTIHVDDITVELDWKKATIINSDMENDAIAVAALYAEMVILAAKARLWKQRCDVEKADVYGFQFRKVKEGGDGRRITDKEAEATAKAHDDYLEVIDALSDADFAIRVTEGLMQALRIKAETLRTLLLKAPSII